MTSKIRENKFLNKMLFKHGLVTFYRRKVFFLNGFNS